MILFFLRMQLGLRKGGGELGSLEEGEVFIYLFFFLLSLLAFVLSRAKGLATGLGGGEGVSLLSRPSNNHPLRTIPHDVDGEEACATLFLLSSHRGT